MRDKRNLRRGSAVLEFALSWTVVSLLFIGVYQYGYTFYVYNALLTEESGAAELGSKMQYDVSNPSAFTSALQNFVVYGDTTPASGAKPIVPGLTTSNVNVAVHTSTGSNGDVTPNDVTITITNYTVPTIFQTFTFNGKPRATTAYLGTVICSGC